MSPSPGSARIALSLSCLLAILSLGPSAAAFCQATTCSQSVMDCERELETSCLVDGTGLSWRRGCVSYAVGESGSALRGLTADDLSRALEAAANTWMSADCGGIPPALELVDLGTAECERAEFNLDGQNANVWMFRDEGWAYGMPTDGSELLDTSTIAFSTLTYDLDSGELLDVDVELNSQHVTLTKEVTSGAFDLTTVVTHEMGHFLGLDHTLEADAMMEAYFPPGVARHDLASDDAEGICALYNSQSVIGSCEPEGGFSSLCGADQPPAKEEKSGGCNIGPARPSSPANWPLTVLISLFLLPQLRRSREG